MGLGEAGVLLVLFAGSSYWAQLQHELLDGLALREQVADTPTADLLTRYYEARNERDTQAARDAAHQLAWTQSLSPEARAAFLAEQASLDMGAGRDQEAHDAMRTLKSWLAGNEEAQLLIDLDIALYMCQHWGEPRERFPTFAERKAHLDSLFATYNPYDKRIVDMHLEYAQLIVTECSQNTLAGRYLREAQQHIDEAQDLTSELRSSPALSGNVAVSSEELDLLLDKATHLAVRVANEQQRLAREQEAADPTGLEVKVSETLLELAEGEQPLADVQPAAQNTTPPVVDVIGGESRLAPTREPFQDSNSKMNLALASLVSAAVAGSLLAYLIRRRFLQKRT